MSSMQDFFIEIAGIAGESKDSKHSGQIDVLNWGYAVSQSSTSHTGGGSGTGKANFSELTFTHYVDKATPTLMKYCASGKHINQVVLTCCKVGDGSQEYMRITMNEVLVTHVSPSGSTGDPRVMESVGLSYGKILVQVKEQNADGSMGATVEGTWDVKQNKE